MYYWATMSMKKEDRDKFDALLAQPPSGHGRTAVTQASGAWSRESELAQFRRAQSGR